MTVRLLVVRHAETDWNRERRYQGWRDTPLSEAGRAQARTAGRVLTRQALAAVWSSPLERARETAAAIAAPHRLTVREEAAFKEMRFGVWEGLTRDEVRARFPAEYQAWSETPHLAVPRGAETLAEVRHRVLAGLEEVRGAHDGQTVCIVAHGISIRILILEALGLGLDRLWSLHVASIGMSELEFRDDGAVVHRVNTPLHRDRLPATR
jgi:alpha-ribazole phosphatase